MKIPITDSRLGFKFCPMCGHKLREEKGKILTCSQSDCDEVWWSHSIEKIEGEPGYWGGREWKIIGHVMGTA